MAGTTRVGIAKMMSSHATTLPLTLPRVKPKMLSVRITQVACADCYNRANRCEVSPTSDWIASQWARLQWRLGQGCSRHLTMPSHSAVPPESAGVISVTPSRGYASLPREAHHQAENKQYYGRRDGGYCQ